MALVLDGSAGVSGVDGTASNPSYEGTDSNTGIFYPAADTVAIGTGGTEALRVNSSQNVGIGTSTAGSKLTVLGTGSIYASTNANTGSGYLLSITGGNSKSSSTDNTNFALFSNDALASNPLSLAMSVVGNATVANGYAYLQASEYGTGNYRSIALNPSGGNVGIGTSSPTSALHVKRTSGNSGIYADYNGTNVGRLEAASNGNLYIGTTVGSGSVYLGNTANASAASLDSNGNLLVGTTTATGKLVVSTSENTLGGNIAATNASYSSTVLQVECSRNTSNSSYFLIKGSRTGVADVFRVADSGNVTNTNNSYGAISDAKLKENVTDATPKLEKLNQVRIVNFNMKGEQQKQIGVIAQELEQIFPGMVEEDQDCTKAVKYSVFVPMLIKAIQELNAKVEAQAAEIAALKGNA